MRRAILRALAIVLALPMPQATALTARATRKAKSTPKTIVITSTQNWTVPSDWSNANNSIECIGGGGGGQTGSNGGEGGGGGGYAKTFNVALTPGATTRFVIGAGGATDAPGGGSWFCNSTANCTSMTSGTGVMVGATAGSAGGSFMNGGVTTSEVGAVRFAGGAGGYISSSSYAGGGGGAAGPQGGGGFGGALTNSSAGGGGGGNGGGRAGQLGSSAAGGPGGGNNASLGGGSGGNAPPGGGGPTAPIAGGAGTLGGGGGGAVSGAGGAGGAGTDLNGSIGGGGGGGGASGSSAATGGAGGLYGGGGGGGVGSGSGGAGGAGVCVVKYAGDVGYSGGTISWVQAQENLVSASTAAFNTGTWSSPPAAGNLLVCWLEYNAPAGTSVSSVVDTAGNTYVKAGPRVTNTNVVSGNYGEEIWYATNVSTSASFRVTATLSTSVNSDKGISCHEYQGARPLVPKDQYTTGSGTSAAPTTSVMSLSAAPSLVIVAGGSASGTNYAAPTKFNRRSIMNGSYYADAIVDAAGSYTPSAILIPSGAYQLVSISFVSR